MYEVPNGAEFREYLTKHGFSAAQAGEIIGVTSRTLRRWTASETAANRVPLPWSAWVLLQLYTGDLTVDQYKEMVQKNSE